jgi:stage II sporulation protein AA (anti-sigma F factor antagonist)
MEEAKIEIETREPADRVRMLELRGGVSRSAEGPLMAAYQEAIKGDAETVILSFRDVEAMDSYGLGLLITLSARARRQGQRLVACGLGAPVQQAFEVSYLDEALEVYADEAEALQSV